VHLSHATKRGQDKEREKERKRGDSKGNRQIQAPPGTKRRCKLRVVEANPDS